MVFLGALCLSGLSPNAVAQDLITQRAWLEDSTGQLQWPEVQQLQPQTYQGVLSKGFGRSVLWIRLRIAGVTPSHNSVQDDLVLRVRPVYLDDIQVFDPVAPNALAGITGDIHHPSQARLKGMDFLVPLAATPYERDIWLRVSSTSTRQISTTVIQEPELINLLQKEHLLFALYVGIVAIISAWGLTNWLFTRDKVAGLFGLMQLTALVYALCGLGYMRVYWPESWSAHSLDVLSSLFSMLATSSAIYFHLVFLSEFKPRAWSLWLMRGLVALLGVNLFLFFVMDRPRLALQINLSTVLITPVVMLISAIFAECWKQQGRTPRPLLPRSMVLGFYVLILAILVLASLPGLGLAAGKEIAIYLVQAHGLASGFLVLMMLQYRARVLQKIQYQSQQQWERLNIQAEQDRQVRQEQEQLLTMLTHELKTPLATMHMRLDLHSKGAADIQRAIRDMNGVIERCLQAAQLGDQGLPVHMTSFDLTALLDDAIATSQAPSRITRQTPEPWHIQSDTQLLFVVLSNLLENACKYAAPDTPIVVQALQSDPAQGPYQWVISNTVGKAGWPDKDKLFSKYYRTPGAQRQAGTGLGLFLVRGLMHKLGGEIAYEPQDNQVRFVLTLPSQP